MSHFFFFPVSRVARCNNLFFILKGLSWHALHYWTPRYFTEVEDPWIFLVFISCSLTCNKSGMVATSCLLVLISIMWSMSWTSMISCERERRARTPWTQLWHRAGELTYPWGRTVRVYSSPYQLRANCFCWALWTGMEKKAFARSITACQVTGDVFICWSNETTSDRAAATGAPTW